jgi:glycosyltransferase involved in cell wall biosynthesis
VRGKYLERALRQRITFVSSMGGNPWGGSEELWSRTALELVAQGFRVSASIRDWSPPHPRALALIERGVEVWLRPQAAPLWKHAWRAVAAPRQMCHLAWRLLATPQKTVTAIEAERLLSARPPALVVISEGLAFPPVDLLEFCIARQLPFATIQHANTEDWVLADDRLAERYRIALGAAKRCYFVSQANRRLSEKQLGCRLFNSEVVWNPINIDADASPATWPPLGPDGELRLACVGRLKPQDKGQDILIEALAAPSWKCRCWRLTLYGEGPMRDDLARLVQSFGLSDRVRFAGFAKIEDIWASNHVLVLPSRMEGLPLAIVEAMLLGRPVVATDVAGNAEVIEDGVTGFLADAPTVGSMAKALEGFWSRRADAQSIGEAGARRIRSLMPADPVQIFTDKIKEILHASHSVPTH